MENLNSSVNESNRNFENSYKAQSKELNKTLQSYQESVSELDLKIRQASENRYRTLTEARESFDDQLGSLADQQKEKLDKMTRDNLSRFESIKKRAEAVEQALKEEEECRNTQISEFQKFSQSKVDELYQKLEQITKVEHDQSVRICNQFTEAIAKQNQLIDTSRTESQDKIVNLQEEVELAFSNRSQELADLKKSICDLQKKTEIEIEAESEDRKRHEKKLTEGVNSIFVKVDSSIRQGSAVYD